MMSKIKEFLRAEPDLSKIKKQYAKIYALVDEMELSFSRGGPVTWEQLGTYEISTAERPIGYPTGKHCMSYRLADQNGNRVFYTVCVAPAGIGTRKAARPTRNWSAPRGTKTRCCPRSR